MSKHIKILVKLSSVLILFSIILILGSSPEISKAQSSDPTPTPLDNIPPDPRSARPLANTSSEIIEHTASAPGYCPSVDGNTEYEEITSLSVERISDSIMKVVVQVYIANPTGCTTGNPCPEYDSSPEYVNAWIDWDGDKTWEASERVMNSALTGYLSINYKGTMTAVSEFVIPSSAINEPTWIRANLGWGYDPNDPCEEPGMWWYYGNILDEEIHMQAPTINSLSVQGIGTENNQPETGSPIRLEADIDVPTGYEIDKCSWVGDLITGEGDQNNNCRYEYTPATGPGPSVDTYGEKDVTLNVTYLHTARNAIGQMTKDLTYKVFFEKDGDDDGDCKWWKVWEPCEPNWFEYWGDDGAVPQLNQSDVKYDPSKGPNSYGAYSQITDNIKLGGAASNTHYPNGIFVPATTNCPGGNFGGATGIDCAAEVIEHEGHHKWIRHNWDSGGIWEGMPDSDEGDPTAAYDDDLPDDYETNTTNTATDNVDSCNLETLKASSYKYYGDNEFAVMVYSDGSTGVASNDWANPGKQTNPPSSSPVQSQATETLTNITSSAISPEFSYFLDTTPSVSGIASLNGSFSDTGEDTNSNSLYDQLKLSVGVDVVSSEVFNIVAWMSDGSSTDIAWASNQLSLTPGTHTVELYFHGPIIRESTLDGPYNIHKSS